MEWAAALPYADGRVGMVGGAYLGLTQLLGISVFNSAFANNRTQAALTFQAQIAMAPFGWHRGSFWPFC